MAITKKKVIKFIPVYYELDKDHLEILKKYMDKLNVDFVFTITPYKKFLEENKIKFIEVLGCYVPEVKIDRAIFFGDGYFHVKEIARKLDLKKLIVINPLEKKVYEIDVNKIKKEFYMKIEKLKKLFNEVKEIGLFTSIKLGQNYEKELLEFKKILEEKYNKKTYLFIGNEFDKNNYLNFYNIKLWIVFACPRIFDDYPNVITQNYLKFIL